MRRREREITDISEIKELTAKRRPLPGSEHK